MTKSGARLVSAAKDVLIKVMESNYPTGTPLQVKHDGFEGTVQGYYVTREGKAGLVLQQHDTRVVHVYGVKWFEPPEKD